MNALFNDLTHHLSSPLGNLILQILVIIVAARVCGSVVRHFGQPQVIGEMLAGIFLGPSLLQPTAPDVHAFLFPEGSVQRLYFLSQIGILLFMFIVGLELDTKLLRSKARSIVVISQASIAAPFTLGIGLAFMLFADYGPHDKGALEFALFMGIAMSITAFPVLARILQEHGLTRSQLGMVAIVCASVDDVTGWCLLAMVSGLVQSGSGTAVVWTIAFAALYISFVLFVVRPFLQLRAASFAEGKHLSPEHLAFAFVAVLLSAWITEMIGIHAIFGAFLMGVAMPAHNGFKEKLAERIHDVTTVILLPLFFAFTGLRTQIGLLDDAQSWLVCSMVLCTAVLGKFGGAALAARFVGYNWRTSCTLGALMNTRGLMELIVLNVGYDLGILSPKIFTMMVIMALVTTMMAGPILGLMKNHFSLVAVKA
jgi:Kef-type K+ transport system membrane component KefB